MKQLKKVVELIIFGVPRFVLPIFYLVLMLELVKYAYVDINEYIQHINLTNITDREKEMVTFIELIDMTMIANLGKMIITGSYNSFVSKDHGFKNENISSGLLKVKMSTSLIGVTSISLLQRGVGDLSKVNWDDLHKLAFIHSLFLLGSIILEVVDYLHIKSDMYEKKAELLEIQISKNEEH